MSFFQLLKNNYLPYRYVDVTTIRSTLFKFVVYFFKNRN